MTINSHRKQSLYLMYLGLCLKTHYQKMILCYLKCLLKCPKELQEGDLSLCCLLRCQKKMREKKRQVFSDVVIVTF